MPNCFLVLTYAQNNKHSLISSLTVMLIPMLYHGSNTHINLIYSFLSLMGTKLIFHQCNKPKLLFRFQCADLPEPFYNSSIFKAISCCIFHLKAKTKKHRHFKPLFCPTFDFSPKKMVACIWTHLLSVWHQEAALNNTINAFKNTLPGASRFTQRGTRNAPPGLYSQSKLSSI